MRTARLRDPGSGITSASAAAWPGSGCPGSPACPGAGGRASSPAPALDPLSGHQPSGDRPSEERPSEERTSPGRLSPASPG
ncbi:hypothetical protein GCM10023334_082520 [Nonomuraea thailandensis]